MQTYSGNEKGQTITKCTLRDLTSEIILVLYSKEFIINLGLCQENKIQF